MAHKCPECGTTCADVDKKDRAIDAAIKILNRPTRSILMAEKEALIKDLWEARQLPLFDGESG